MTARWTAAFLVVALCACGERPKPRPAPPAYTPPTLSELREGNMGDGIAIPNDAGDVWARYATARSSAREHRERFNAFVERMGNAKTDEERESLRRQIESEAEAYEKDAASADEWLGKYDGALGRK